MSNIKLSYGITVKDELEEVKRLVNFLLSNKREYDEIVILYDTNGSIEVYDYVDNLDEIVNVFVVKDKFQGHFADWKNKLTSYCSGDYIFAIDADELPHKTLIDNLPAILELNPDNEVYLVPRVNTVEGITREHIQKWNWSVDSNNWINYPDYQWRIYKNKGTIRWVNKVHERLEGFKTYATMPAEEDWSLYHPKTIQKQEKQNSYYETL
jgi:hypothetical protein